MKTNTIIIFFILILLQGCSTKKVSLKPLATQTDMNLTQKSTALPISSNDEIDNEDFDEEYTNQETDIKDDPFSGYNRLMTTFNDHLFTYALNPLSEGYAYITPEPIRQSVANFLHNLQFPIRFTNNLLQGKLQNSSDELERFIVNTTVGIGGLFDPAHTYMHIPVHNEDFGQTLGSYGVGTGYHIVLPFLGPSNIRDGLGLIADGYLTPLIYQSGLKRYKIPQNYVESIGIYGFDIINKNALHLGAYESLKKDSIDLYPFLRDLYEQKRLSDIAE